jgi:meiotic recombination protein DMC1
MASAIVKEDQVDQSMDLDGLQSQGINVADIRKLQAAGICTIKGLRMTTRKKLCTIKGLSEAKVDKIREALIKLYGASGEGSGLITALQASINRQSVFRITTGSKELDRILGGGVESMSITEAFGEFRTGKTQLSHTLAITTQLTGGKVIYLDTENTFRPDRLEKIADRFNLDRETALNNVLTARVYTSDQQMEYLAFAAAKCYEEPGMTEFPANANVKAVQLNAIRKS